MKFLQLLSIVLFPVSILTWQPDMQTAKKKAVDEHKLILLNFSGSDWCIPCIRMHQEFFTDEQFQSMADASFVLLNADFPRTKKKQLEKTAQAKNDALAAAYNNAGKFPLTLLLSADGKVLQQWEGYKSQDKEKLLADMRQVIAKYLR